MSQETMTVEIPEDVRTSLAGDSGYEVPAKIEGVPKGTTKADIEKKIRARIDAFRAKSNISGDDLMQLAPEVRDKVTAIGGMRSEQEMIEGDMVGLGAAIYDRDKGIDYHTGVQNFGLRYDLGRDDTPEEKEKRLDERVGAGNWGKDSSGEYYLNEAGTKAVGTEYNGYPVAIDEQRFSPVYDVADLLGDAPAIIGSMMTKKGAGALLNIGRAGFFAMVGKTGEETWESVTGQNLQPMSEVGGEIVEEGFLAATGEGGVRIASKFGKKFFAPEEARMTPERKAAMDKSLEMGLKPDSSQVTDAPLVGRFEGLKRQIFGDKKAAENSARIRQEINKLEDEMGAENAIRATGKKVVDKVRRRTDAFKELYTRHMRETRQLVRKQVDDFSVKLGNKNEDIGTATINNIRDSYGDFNGRVRDAYSIIDRTRGIKLYPMAKIKAEARDQLSRILRTAKEDAVKGHKSVVSDGVSIKEVGVKGKKASGGDPVLTSGAYVKRLERIIAADDMIDLTGAQELRTFLSNAAYSPDLLKGVESRHARLLRDAVDRGFLDVENGAVPEIAVLMRNARKMYSDGMDLYSDVFIKKMVRVQGVTGAVEPSLVVDTVIRHPASVRGMKKVLEQTDEGRALWQSVQREHFDTILDKSIDIEGFVKPEDFARELKGSAPKTEALKELYGSNYRELHKFSRELAAIDGKINAKELQEGGVKAALQKAQKTKAEMDLFTAQDWVKELGKTGREFVTAVDHVFKPKHPERVLAAKNFYGEGSETWSRVKRVAMKDILSDVVKKNSDDIFVDVLDGGALKKALNKYGRDTIEEMFGEQHATQLYSFADAVEFIARKPKQASGTLVASSIAVRPWKHLGTLARVWGLSSVMSTERGLQYLTEGFLRPQNTLGKITRPAAENILRFQIQMQMLVNDDNGDLFEYFMGGNAPTPEEMKQEIRNQ